MGDWSGGGRAEDNEITTGSPPGLEMSISEKQLRLSCLKRDWWLEPMTVESVTKTSGEEGWWIDWAKDVEDGAARWSKTTEKVYVSLLFFFYSIVKLC